MKNIESEGRRDTARKILLTGLGLFSLAPLLRLFSFSRKKDIIACAPGEKRKTQKVLTRDGQLMEVDISHIRRVEKKISNKDLQQWVKRR